MDALIGCTGASRCFPTLVSPPQVFIDYTMAGTLGKVRRKNPLTLLCVNVTM